MADEATTTTTTAVEKLLALPVQFEYATGKMDETKQESKNCNLICGTSN